jgi:hypothetical protein
MLKRVSTLLGVGLLALWALGLGDTAASSWVVWFLGLGSLWSFGIALFSSDIPSQSERIAQPLALSVGLFAVWLIGITIDSAQWLNRWTFVAAVAYFLFGVSGLTRRKRAAQVHPLEKRSEEKVKKIA